MTFKEYRKIIASKEVTVIAYRKAHEVDTELGRKCQLLSKSIKNANTALRWMTAIQFVSLSLAFGSFQAKQYWLLPFILLIPYLFFGLFLMLDYFKIKKQDDGSLMSLLETITTSAK